MNSPRGFYCWIITMCVVFALSACEWPGQVDVVTKGAESGAQAAVAVDPPNPENVDKVRVVRVDTLEHAYRLYSTGATIKAGPVPLVISLHGGKATAEGHDGYTGLRLKAAAASFALLTPSGTGASWNAGSCCEPAKSLEVNHAAVIAAMIDDASTILDVDPRRVFVTGHSNGGMLAYRLACELSERIAAIAPNAAVMMNRDLEQDPPAEVFVCEPSRPVPVLHLHGLADRCAPYEGGVSAGDGTQRSSVAESLAFWTRNNHCPSQPLAVTYAHGAARCVVYAPCQDRAPVELCTIEGAGHIWPGNGVSPDPDDACGGTGSDDLIANDYIWDFFRRHPMP